MHRTRVVMSPFFSLTRKESVWYGVHPDQDFLWQILPFDIGLPQNSFGYTFQSCSGNECSWARRAYLFLQTVPAVNQCAWSQWSIYQLYLCCDYTKGLEGVPHWTGATELTGWWEKCHPHSVRAHTVLTRGPAAPVCRSCKAQLLTVRQTERFGLLHLRESCVLLLFFFLAVLVLLLWNGRDSVWCHTVPCTNRDLAALESESDYCGRDVELNGQATATRSWWMNRLFVTCDQQTAPV